MENITYFTKNRKQRHKIKGEYNEHNRIIIEIGVVLSKDNTALFFLTKKGVNKFVYILFFVVRRYPSNIRAPPLILKPNHFKMNGGLLIVNLFY